MSDINDINERIVDLLQDMSDLLNSPIEQLQGIQEDINAMENSSNSVNHTGDILYYRPEHFIIEELVDEKTFNDRGQKAFDLLEPKMLWTIDQLRKIYGSITINNWKWGGQFQYSGFRPKHCLTGAAYSQHRLGKAFDLKFKDHEPAKIREDIRNNPDREEFKYITCVEEDTPTWLHIDCRGIKNRILWVPYR